MISDKSEKTEIKAASSSNVPNPELFAETLGIACWLMSMSKDHKALPMSSIEARILPAILLKQFKVIKKGKMPVAYISWALVSDDVKAATERTGEAPELKQWRAGQNLIVVDCISPFAPSEKIIEGFLARMSPSSAKN